MKNIVMTVLLATCLLQAADLKLTPSFESCSVSIVANPTTQDMTMRFRECGSNLWKEALPPAKLPTQMREATNYCFFGQKLVPLPVHQHEWRGSIVFLKENTSYEIEVTMMPEKEVLTKTVKTKSIHVPITKTVYLDELPKKAIMVIEAKGKPDAWIRYTMKNSKAVIKAQEEQNQAIIIRNSHYLILEGITACGGRRHVIEVRNSQNIHIINCELFGHAKRLRLALEDDGKMLGMDGRKMWGSGALRLLDASDILVERCYIHSPAGSANSWFHSHSSGPMAIATRRTKGGLVFRYNDFIGSDLYRWDDVIGGGKNSSTTGGFNHHADIYGNMFVLANDDGIEMDGGQSNVRCFLNHFEGMLCGISVAPCIIGPSYVFRNQIVNMGDQNHMGSVGLKTVFADAGVGRIHFFSNTSPQISLPAQKCTIELAPRLVTRNNDVSVPWSINSIPIPADMDYDLLWNPDSKRRKRNQDALTKAGQESHAIWGSPRYETHSFRLKPDSPGWKAGIRIPNFQDNAPCNLGAYPEPNSPDLPFRPIPFTLNRYAISFAHPNKLAPATLKLKVTGDFSAPFVIRKNVGVDWFKVTPSQGLLKDGMTFTVELDPQRILSARRHRDAFLIRLPNGFSRPVMVNADMRASEELRAKETGFYEESYAKALQHADSYGPGTTEGSVLLRKKTGTKPLIWNFTVPEDGYYYVFAQFFTTGIQLKLFEFSMDGDKAGPLERPMFGGDYTKSVWRLVYRKDKPGDKYYEAFKLKKGKHNLIIHPQRPMTLEKLCITDSIWKIYR